MLDGIEDFPSKKSKVGSIQHNPGKNIKCKIFYKLQNYKLTILAFGHHDYNDKYMNWVEYER